MELLPAIDLLDGGVVRLAKGAYDRVTRYPGDPTDVAKAWQDQGATRLHIVDLAAARDGASAQSSIVADIVGAVSIPCQVAGGIRDIARAQALLDAGVDRVVMGTALVRTPDAAGSIVDALGAERLVAAIDVRGGVAMGDGWTPDAASVPALGLVAALRAAGVARFAVTAIDRDGLLEGPDLGLLAAAADVAGGADHIIASAGVSTLEDVRTLAHAGYAAAILGRALYEERLSLPAALLAATG